MSAHCFVYMPICAICLIYSIIVLVQDKTNKTVRFHAFQSLLLTVAYIVVMFGAVIFGIILGAVTGSFMLGMLINLIIFVIVIVFLGLMILGMGKSLSGTNVQTSRYRRFG